MGTFHNVGGHGARRLRQRGAALLDLLIGAAAALVIFAFLVSLLHTLVLASASRHALMLARSQSDQLTERMRSEAASAWSISVPASDVNGDGNADGHEIDFGTEDATRARYSWCYFFNVNAQTVTRYTLAPGASPQPGPVYSQITAFSAQAYPASAISQPSSALYDPLFTGSTVTSVSYQLPDGSVAGNAFVDVTLGAAGTSRSVLLATGVAPTQFTVIVQYTPPP